MAKLRVCYDDVVELQDGKKGTVKYIGYTDFLPGRTWFGIELEKKEGKHNGKIKNRVYFVCPENCGVFVQSKDIVTVLKSFAEIKKIVSKSVRGGEGGPSITSLKIFFFLKKKGNNGPHQIPLNEIAMVNNYGKGRVRFIGQTKFDETGIWYGIELVEKGGEKAMKGNNNGSIDNVCGVFVRPDQVKPIGEKADTIRTSNPSTAKSAKRHSTGVIAMPAIRSSAHMANRGKQAQSQKTKNQSKPGKQQQQQQQQQQQASPSNPKASSNAKKGPHLTPALKQNSSADDTTSSAELSSQSPSPSKSHQLKAPYSLENKDAETYNSSEEDEDEEDEDDQNEEEEEEEEKMKMKMKKKERAQMRQALHRKSDSAILALNALQLDAKTFAEISSEEKGNGKGKEMRKEKEKEKEKKGEQNTSASESKAAIEKEPTQPANLTNRAHSTKSVVTIKPANPIKATPAKSTKGTKATAMTVTRAETDKVKRKSLNGVSLLTTKNPTSTKAGQQQQKYSSSGQNTPKRSPKGKENEKEKEKEKKKENPKAKTKPKATVPTSSKRTSMIVATKLQVAIRTEKQGDTSTVDKAATEDQSHEAKTPVQVRISHTELANEASDNDCLDGYLREREKERERTHKHNIFKTLYVHIYVSLYIVVKKEKSPMAKNVSKKNGESRKKGHNGDNEKRKNRGAEWHHTTMVPQTRKEKLANLEKVKRKRSGSYGHASDALRRDVRSADQKSETTKKGKGKEKEKEKEAEAETETNERKEEEIERNWHRRSAMTSSEYEDAFFVTSGNL
ncbi:hypothetical protein RFI_25117 [Reticulomyxa filosa]|uniref:CAP-Gly domain-containing protein n=1 Tax=Reticulomyxa filosa TaxID=46433 RepID=X6MGT6_RETFI|nr:hypothetical protein RFI_25117 [Reticulomyxa filosa]|eukprot:ETO12260.1 hypothetical protein RFI_25117 [Reticulomyxa filosa]